MKLQLLAFSTAAVAVTRATSAAAAVVSKDDVSSFGTALRSLIGVSFSEQAEDAIEAFIEGDEGEPNKEKNSPMHSTSSEKGSTHDSRSDPSNKSSKKSGRYSVTEGMCNPDTTKPERLAICEDLAHLVQSR
eukprot:479589_1